MSSFIVGDKVLCVDDTSRGDIREGAFYIVAKVAEDYIQLKGAGPGAGFRSNRFIKIDDTPLARAIWSVE